MMKEKYFCRTCSGLRNHKQIHEEKRKGSENEDSFQWVHKFLIIECLGCETLSFLEIYGDTGMITYSEEGPSDYYFDETIFPRYLETKPLEKSYFIPKMIKTIYDETIESFKADSKILTAGGLRAIIEATCNHLKIKKANLADRIDLLYKGGYLTLNESKRLHSIRFLGNDALHEMEKPKKEQLYILLDIINHLLGNLFINDKKIEGKVDTIIDKYEEFLKLIQNKIKKEMVNHEYTVEQIIGKSKRLVPAVNYKYFIDKFKHDVEENKHNFITVRTTTKKVIFKIIKEPDFAFDWF